MILGLLMAPASAEPTPDVTTASLSGRLLNADGTTFDGTAWSVVARPVTGGAGFTAPVDGTGSFRIEGVTPGSYLLFAAVLEEHAGIPPAYYGDTLDPAAATIVTVVAGQDFGGLDIALYSGENAPVLVVASSSPTISGVPRVGSVLRADPGYWYLQTPGERFSQELATTDFTYTWTMNGRVIRGVTGSRLALRWWMRGHVIRVEVTPSINLEQPLEFRVDVPTTSGPTRRVR